MARAAEAARGGYVLVREVGGGPEVTLLATGSEVGVAVETARVLASEGRRVRVVSLPCLEAFERQETAWRDEVLPSTGKRVSIEAGRTTAWRGWVGTDGLCIGVDTFGASAPAEVLAEKFGLTAAQVAERVRAFLGGARG
jgi:transketolase